MLLCVCGGGGEGTSRELWWLMDRLARVLVIDFSILLDEGVKPFWPVVGLSMFCICVWTEFVGVTRV